MPSMRNTRQLPPAWRGIRMRRVSAGADPDAPQRLITLPAAWDDVAAAGAGGTGARDGARSRWQTPPRPGSPHRGPRRGAGPGDPVGRPAASPAALPPRGAVASGLAGNCRSGAGLRAEPARRSSTRPMASTWPALPRRSKPRLSRWRWRCRARGALRSAWRTSPGCWRRWGWITARDAARDVARALAAILRGRADAASARLAPAASSSLAAPPPGVTLFWPAPPEQADLPGLAEAAQAARAAATAAGAPRHLATTAIAPARSGRGVAGRGDRRHRPGLLAAGGNPGH